MAPQKRLSWEEWQRRANADYVKGEFGVQQMISSWGYPEGMSAETHKIEFDKGKAKLKNRAGRRAQRAKYNAARTARIGSSRKTVNKVIRDEAAAQWDELVGDRNATINIGGKSYSFDKYLNKEVRDHSKLTRQKAVEAVNLGKSLGHGTPTTDVGRYAESYTQQFAETPTGNYATQDYIPPDQLERLQKAGLATSPQEAARLHVGTTKIGGRLPDVKIEEILKINASGNLARAGSQGPTVTTKGLMPQPEVVLTTSQSLGQKAAAIANREPVKPPKPVVVAPKPVAVKPKPKPKPKTVTKPTPVVAAKTTKVKPTSASMQIRAMQNTVPDALRIQPGMSLPSASLIQGI